MLRLVVRSLFTAGLAAVVACDDDTPETDASVADTGTPDAGRYDGGPKADAAPRPDSGPLPDTGTTDLRCVENGVITVGATNVSVGESSGASTVSGASADLSCIGEDPPRVLAGGVTFRACLQVLGGAVTKADVESQLSIAVFKSFDSQVIEDRVDPSKNTDGSDRRADRRISPDIVVSENTDCPSGIQIELGRDVMAEHQLKADLPYAIRLTASSSVGAAASRWATSYVFGAGVKTADLEAGSGLGGNCSPNVCRGRVDLFAVEQTWLKDQVARSGALVEGGTNLTDNDGDGYAVVQANDCKDSAMAKATVGFSPAPSEAGYLGEDRIFSSATNETASHGLFIGLGFAGTSSTTPATITTAIGASSDGSCTEEYAGGQLSVFPDSVSVLRAGYRSVLR
ncbi:MAG: hypothetical protein HY791_05690 [Deltaproteobacteria bacterium]|nr:hypothetical protein [Deltaproteobacteria bacterium]